MLFEFSYFKIEKKIQENRTFLEYKIKTRENNNMGV
jgi:hypothetical protein